MFHHIWSDKPIIPKFPKPYFMGRNKNHILLCTGKTILCPTENHLSIYAKVYFWAHYSIPSVCMFVFMPVPHGFDYCSLILLVLELYGILLFVFLRSLFLWFGIERWICITATVLVFIEVWYSILWNVSILLLVNIWFFPPIFFWGGEGNGLLLLGLSEF